MPTVLALTPEPEHPLDAVENLAGRHGWMIERSCDDEATMLIAGAWSDLHLSMSWHDQLEGLHLACGFDLKVPAGRRDEVARLVSLINEQLYFGHFDLWREEGTIVFRNGLLLSGRARVSEDQCEAMIQLAIDACERHFPAFQYVIWAGRSAADALKATMLDTVGEA